MPNTFSVKELRAFENRFDVSREDKAFRSRRRFVQAFPLRRLKDLTLNKYVIGLGTASFCALVEAKTRAWANIQGSPVG